MWDIYKPNSVLKQDFLKHFPFQNCLASFNHVTKTGLFCEWLTHWSSLLSQFWFNLTQFWLICTDIMHFDLIYPILILFDSFWLRFQIQFDSDSIKLILIHFDSFWFILTQFDSVWLILTLFDSYCISFWLMFPDVFNLTQFKSVWVSLIHLNSVWFWLN